MLKGPWSFSFLTSSPTCQICFSILQDQRWEGGRQFKVPWSPGFLCSGTIEMIKPGAFLLGVFMRTGLPGAHSSLALGFASAFLVVHCGHSPRYLSSLFLLRSPCPFKRSCWTGPRASGEPASSAMDHLWSMRRTPFALLAGPPRAVGSPGSALRQLVSHLLPLDFFSRNQPPVLPQ